MDVNTMIQLINGVGFPIAACIAMGVFIVWDKRNRREDKKLEDESTKELFETLKESLDNNTRTLEKLIQKIDERGV